MPSHVASGHPKQITRAVAHDARVVPSEIALVAINDGALYARHMNAAKADRAGNHVMAANLFYRSASDTAIRLAREFDQRFPAADICAAALELAEYYAAHLLECK